MTWAIQVEHLSKEYEVGDLQTFDTLRDRLAHGARSLLRGAPPREHAGGTRIHHALQDINFSANQGEVLGIIGRNGAGKSTLLKILARVTSPTSGRARVRGRLAPLLEVGTGFNTELTGRENVYVNGTLLGMSRREIDAKFDEIVEFAGVHKYIDTPVKRYSSGMIVRLGFAVAAHLEPEILIVDEVLAVGDSAFQRRCLGKMNEFAGAGRTVLFVSHNMAAMVGFCSRVIWLDGGRVRTDGEATAVVQSYLTHSMSDARENRQWPPVEERKGNGAFHFTGCRLVDDAGQICDPVMVGQNVRFEVDFRTEPHGRRHGSVRLWLRAPDGRDLVLFATTMTGRDMEHVPAEGRLVCHIPRFSLGPGTYSVYLVGVLGQELSDMVETALVFDVVAGDYFGTGNSMTESVAFVIDHGWSLAEAPSA